MIKKTLDPVWQEGFEFDETDSGQVLTIEVFDEDMVGNDFLGLVRVQRRRVSFSGTLTTSSPHPAGQAVTG